MSSLSVWCCLVVPKRRRRSLSRRTRPLSQQGECATLTWSSTHASTVSIDQGVGTVDPSGTKQVCPETSTKYTITAAGEGGSGTASTMIEVAAMAAKVMTFPEAALFEFGKSELKPEGKEKIGQYLVQAKEELARADQVAVTGYTDTVGEPDFNSTLSLQRAEAVRDQLVSLGADPRSFTSSVRASRSRSPITAQTRVAQRTAVSRLQCSA